jgi:hypothetical protein
MGRSRIVFFMLGFATCCLLFLAAAGSQAASTGFTYQGQLKQNGAPATGAFDMRFTLFDDEVAGNPVGPVETKSGASAVQVSNGLFSVVLDFKLPAFTGQDRWLKIEVSNPGANNYVALPTRQKLTPAPYALNLVEQPKAQLGRNTNLAVPNVNGLVVPFEIIYYNVGDLYENTNPTRLTCKVAGVYSVSAAARFTGSAAGSRSIQILHNGVPVATAQADAFVNSPTIISTTTNVKLASGDYVELLVGQNSGSPLILEADSQSGPRLIMARLP